MINDKQQLKSHHKVGSIYKVYILVLLVLRFFNRVELVTKQGVLVTFKDVRNLINTRIRLVKDNEMNINGHKYA